MTHVADQGAYTPDPSEFPVMTHPFWSLEMTMAWIIWRDASRVAEHSAEYRSKVRIYEEAHPLLGGAARLRLVGPSSMSEIADEVLLIENAQCSYEQAKRELWNVLGSNAVQATALEGSSGSVLDIPPSRWAFLSEWNGEPDRVCLATDFFQEVFTRIRLPVSTIVSIWPAVAGSSRKRQGRPSSTATRRGAKPRYDWGAFNSELSRLILDKGAPIADPDWNQASVETRMLEWCSSEWRREPSESTIRAKVGKYLASL